MCNSDGPVCLEGKKVADEVEAANTGLCAWPFQSRVSGKQRKHNQAQCVVTTARAFFTAPLTAVSGFEPGSRTICVEFVGSFG